MSACSQASISNRLASEESPKERLTRPNDFRKIAPKDTLASLMSLQLFNTRTRSLEEFAPIDPTGQKLAMYCCGPTVHNHAHIGNFRTFVFFDLLRRHLEFSGFTVRQVMNVTDVEDKIIAAVRTSGEDFRGFTRRYEELFFADQKLLGCLPLSAAPRATEHIAEIIDLIRRLSDRGLAYRASDGSVYFSIEAYRAAGHNYGQLLKIDLDALRPGQRVSADEYDKESVDDFALWKARVPDDGEIFWPSPWGEGRPGWHIECSAMSVGAFGPSFDLHVGGEDLVFPHHEDEIAQTEGARLEGAGRHFVNYWAHVAHLVVEGKMMSKSLGNYFTIRDLVAKGYSGREIRFLLLSAHHRSTCNFTLENLAGARTALARLDEWFTALHEVSPAPAKTLDPEVIGKFRAAMDDDLNVSAAWGVVFEWVRASNRAIASGAMTPQQAGSALATWDAIGTVLGLSLVRLGSVASTTSPGAAAPGPAGAEIPPEILSLAEARGAARKAKDFKQADAIRQELARAGWIVEDTPKGARLKRA